ncbi:MAG: hypothetical protein HOV81_31275 [Kofleriaceae bacterium]|nr:hypothetical protein [Kofleriaceae bacterium]
MKTSYWLSIIAAAVLATGAASFRSARAGEPCARTKFETKLVADACAAGGLAKAKDVMKKWVKDNKSKQSGLECASCHSKMAPTYDLKPGGLETYRKLGGH